MHSLRSVPVPVLHAPEVVQDWEAQRLRFIAHSLVISLRKALVRGALEQSQESQAEDPTFWVRAQC